MQAVDENVIERFHSVILQNDTEQIVEVMWALGNLACEGPEFAKILLEDEIFSTLTTMLNSNNVKVTNEVTIFFKNHLTTLDYELLSSLLRD